jgi:glutaconate CoA-transferase subunit B
MTGESYSLAELTICAAAEAWRNDGEVLATGIGTIPRLAAGLAKLTCNPALMMTDGENTLVAEPVPLGDRNGYVVKAEGWMPYERTFSLLWGGKRHAMVGPVQIDRFGQTNISVIGTHAKPKAALLGSRGFPGNTIHHPNSMFVPTHNTRSFVAGEVDFVAGAGYNRERWPGGHKPAGLDLRLIVTDLAVLDFGGDDHQIRVLSLHPGISFEQVRENTGFPLARQATLPVTPAPRADQLALIRDRLDPQGLRRSVFKGDPPGDRS